MATKYTKNIQQLLNNKEITTQYANEMMKISRKPNQQLREHLVGEVNSGLLPKNTASTILRNATKRQNCSCTISGGKK
jgi:hypothetical protein